MQAVSVAMPLGLSLCSCSVNSGTSTAGTSIIAEAGSSEGGISELGDSKLCDAEMMDFFGLRGGAARQHLNSFGQYEKALNGWVQADCWAAIMQIAVKYLYRI